VLSMMDKSAKDFHSLTADLEHIKYTAVVQDTSTETGQIFARKDEKMRIDFQKPDQRTILREGDNLYIYTPKSAASRSTTSASTAPWRISIWHWASARRATISRKTIRSA